MTSTQVCAKFTLRDIESQTDHIHEDCHEEPNSCPEFHIFIPDTETFVSVDIYTNENGEDPLLVDAMQFFNPLGELLQSWSEKDGEARCIFHECDHECWPIAGAEYPVKGVKLLAAGGLSNILYENEHCCQLRYQCESNICIGGVCGGGGPPG